MEACTQIGTRRRDLVPLLDDPLNQEAAAETYDGRRGLRERGVEPVGIGRHEDHTADAGSTATTISGRAARSARSGIRSWPLIGPPATTGRACLPFAAV